MCSFYFFLEELPVSDFYIESHFFQKRVVFFVCIVSLGTTFPPQVALGRSTSREQVLKYQTLKVTQGIANVYNTSLYIVFFLFFLFLVEDVLPQRLHESHAILSMDIQWKTFITKYFF